MEPAKVALMIFFSLQSCLCDGVEKPKLDVATTPEYGGTLTFTCTVNTGSNFIQTIEIGKIQQSGRRQIVLASIGSNNQIVNYGTRDNVGIDGHLDPGAFATAFLRLRIHYVHCNQSGAYYCTVNGEVVQTVAQSVNVCDGVAVLTIENPNKFDPTNTVFTCALNPNITGITNVTYMALCRIRASSSKRELIAFANISENNGEVQKSVAFIQNGVYAYGHLNTTNTLDSTVQVNLLPGTCDDAGTYMCHVIFTDSVSMRERFALTEETHSINSCTSSNVHISIQKHRTTDPTSFKVQCGFNSERMHTYNKYGQSVYYTLKFINLELSLLPDTLNGQELRHQVMYWDTFSQNQDPTIAADYKQRGFSGEGSPSSGNLEFYTGPAGSLCQDTGVYRCKFIYTRSDESGFAPVFEFAEARLPACNPGAVYRVTNGTTGAVTCTADPAEVHALLSLEVSQILDRSLKVIAAINIFLNNAQPISQFDAVSVSGKITPYDSAASYLNITMSLPAHGGHTRKVAVPTRCKAVFIGFRNQSVIESFTDGLMTSV